MPSYVILDVIANIPNDKFTYNMHDNYLSYNNTQIGDIKPCLTYSNTLLWHTTRQGTYV